MTARATVVHPDDDADWSHLFDRPGPRGVTVRGLGASYSDASLNTGGTVAATTAQRGVGPIHPQRGVVDVDAGTPMQELLAACIPKGWLPPVLPGTANLTVGGAFAADVHGKNHTSRSSFSQHVRSAVVLTPGDGVVTVGPAQDPDAFWATAGGLGLTGVVRRVQLQLTRISSSWLLTRDLAAANLDDVVTLMLAASHAHEHVVAWIDGHTTGAATGRGVLTTADHLSAAALASGRARQLLTYQPARRRALASARINLVRPTIVRSANAARFARARRADGIERISDLSQTFHPLDAVADWPSLYGRNGLVQYQFSVPDGAEHVLDSVLRALPAVGAPPSLVVLKRFGHASPGHLSFPSPGWTMALDLPAPPDPSDLQVLDRLDEQVVDSGGRVYLVKDCRMRADLVPQMYPELDRWRSIRDRLDPEGLLTSDLDRRLHLTGRHRERQPRC